jgi:hypothetical protein
LNKFNKLTVTLALLSLVMGCLGSGAISNLVLSQGLGFTGNFYNQTFILSPGESSEGVDAYVVIVNTETSPMRVEITTSTPPGVTLDITEREFVLSPNSKKQLDIIVDVNLDAKPGDYFVEVSATAYNAGLGIQVTGGGYQRANLQIKGAGKMPLLPAAISIGTLGLVGVLWLIFKQRQKRKRN